MNKKAENIYLRRFNSAVILVYFAISYLSGFYILFSVSAETTVTSFGLDGQKIGRIGATLAFISALGLLIIPSYSIWGVINDLFRLRPRLVITETGLWIRGRMKYPEIPWVDISNSRIEKVDMGFLLWRQKAQYLSITVRNSNRYLRTIISNRKEFRIYASHLWSDGNLSANELHQMISEKIAASTEN